MDKQSTLQIIRTLAQGIDPYTGERYPAESPYQHPDTVRALFQAAEALSTGHRPRSTPSSTPENAGKPWTDEEDQSLAQLFDSGETISGIAKHHRRSRAAIQARLIRLGKIAPPANGPRFWVNPATHAAQ
jgi:hypothetical protein